MSTVLAQIAHRRKAIVALIGALATFVVAVSADSTAGHYASLILALVNGAAVHAVKNGPHPRRAKR